jgi:hypothetical protein
MRIRGCTNRLLVYCARSKEAVDSRELNPAQYPLYRLALIGTWAGQISSLRPLSYFKKAKESMGRCKAEETLTASCFVNCLMVPGSKADGFVLAQWIPNS